MKKIYFIMCLIALCLCVKAEPVMPKASLSGHITDATDGSALIGVTVMIPELSTGTVTDTTGYYAFSNLPKKVLTLQVSYLGHQTIIYKVDLNTRQRADFVMKEANAQLNEVVVTGLSGKSLLKDSPVPISYVSAATLATTASTNIIDALSHQPGISQITTGGGISKPVIRGLGFNRLVVVDDGIRQEGNQWGDEHGIEVDANSVHDAEVIKGPASLMYGSDALAGVIVLHSFPPMARNTSEGDLTAEYQSNQGLFGYSADFRGNRNGWVWNGRWSQKLAHDYHNAADNYVVGSRFSEQAAQAMAGLNGNWGYSHWLLSYYHLTPGMAEGDRSDDAGSYGKALPFQQIHHYKVVTDHSLFLGNGTLQAIVGYQQNRRQEYEESKDAPGLDMQLHTINYDVKYALRNTQGWQATAGINGMWQRNLNRGSEYLIPGYQLFDAGLFATSGYKTGDWRFSGGLRVDHRHIHGFAQDDVFSTLSRSFTSVSGSVGMVFAPNEHTNLRLNVARGFRSPNLSELASNGVHEGTQQYMLGNGSLSAEHSWQADAGWDYTSAMLTTQLQVFANFIDNYIYASRVAGAEQEGVPVYQYTQGDARLLGGEALIDFHPVEQLHFQNSFSYVNSVQLHQPREAKYLPYSPAPRWNSELRYIFVRDGQTLDNTFMALSAECNLRQNHFYALNNTETATPSYTLLNISAGTEIKWKRRKRAAIVLTAENITDRVYQSHLSRLKYIGGVNPANNRSGLFNMGRNITAKVTFYLP